MTLAVYAGSVTTSSSHMCHEFLESPFMVIFMNKQHFFDCTLLEAHLIELSQQSQELCSLRIKKKHF